MMLKNETLDALIEVRFDNVVVGDASLRRAAPR